MLKSIINKRLSLSFILLSVSLLTTPIHNANAAAQTGTVVSDGGAVNIRDGKGTKAKVITKIKPGEKLQILDTTDEEWYKIDLGNKKVGYISGDYIDLEADSTSADNADATETVDEVVIVTGNMVNIREGKGTDTNTIGKARKGDKLDALEVSGDWYKVELSNGKVGYIHKDYLKTAADAKIDAAKETDKKTGADAEKVASDNKETMGTVVTKSGNLNVRESSAKDAEVVGQVKKGDQVRLLKKTGDWYQIELEDGTVGYVNHGYIKVGAIKTVDAGKDTKTPSDSATPLLGEGTVTTRTAALNIRADKTTNSKVIGAVAKGDKVTVLEKAGDWYKVELADGSTGYASRQFIKVAKSDSATAKKLMSVGSSNVVKGMTGDGIVITKSAPLNIRGDNKDDAEVVAQASKGAKVQVLEKAGKWYKVKLEDGTVGYASSRFIQMSAESGATNDTEAMTTKSGYGEVVTKGSILNIRAGKDLNAKVIAKIPNGSKVRILEKSGIWYKVQLEDGKTTGYAHSKFIQ